MCVNQSVNLSCFTDQRTNITWFWLNQSKEGSTITVKVTQYAVVFTCKASAENGQVGKANVTVIANGENYKHKMYAWLLYKSVKIRRQSAKSDVLYSV